MSTLARLTTALADRYSVVRELGAGGMATVYLAHDIKHERDVAIKVLHPDLGAALGADRFLSEIKTTAKLQHPHILPLLDSGAADGLLYYVMPFVRGETLRARLDRERQLPIDDAVRLARECADALAHAHEQGIIHRDIKPENILLQGPSGNQHALVADFGIALAVQEAGGARMTQTGLSLGTPQYMAPEQAMGERIIDARADIYALGAVTYEMLAGEPPFTGPTSQAIVARMMVERPRPLSTVRERVSPQLAEAIETALSKLPADRFATVQAYGDALRVSTYASDPRRERSDVTVPSTPQIAARTRARYRDPVVIGATLLAVAATTWAAVGSRRSNTGDARVTAAVIPLEIRNPTNVPFNEIGVPIALAPDGNFLVYVGRDPDQLNGTMLWKRNLSEVTATPIAGTQNAQRPIISSDGRSIYFSVRSADLIFNVTRVVPVDGGVARPVLGVKGSMWRPMADGGVLVLDSTTWTLARAKPDAATVEVSALSLLRQLVMPSDLSPDGTHGLTARGDSMFIHEVDRPGRRYLGDGMYPQFIDDRTLAYRATFGALMVGRLNDDRTAFVRAPIATIGNITLSPSQAPIFSVGRDGTLVYSDGVASSASRLTWVNRSGVVDVIADQEARLYQAVLLDRSGSRVLEMIGNGAGSPGEVWIEQLETHTRIPIALDGRGGRPAWTAAESSVVYISMRNDRTFGESLASRSLSGDAAEVPVEGPWIPGLRIGEVHVSSSGAQALRTVRIADGNRDIYARVAPGGPFLPIAADRVAQERAPRFSPDGRLLAFVSDISRREEIYMQGFPAGARIQLSESGGREPVWSPDGRALYYRDLDGYMVEVTIESGSSPRVMRRTRLFDASAYASNQFVILYDVARDGRFLMLKRDAQTPRNDIVIIRNWLPRIMAQLDSSVAR